MYMWILYIFKLVEPIAMMSFFNIKEGVSLRAFLQPIHDVSIDHQALRLNLLATVVISSN